MKSICLFIFIFFAANIFSQSNYVIINPYDTPEEIIQKAADITPSYRQYEWQKLELTGFIHFGINTFMDAEWGKKDFDITKFNPAEINVEQWVEVFKEAGMKLIILTAKHHDGFCLWPTKYTAHNISNTPFQNGKGDIVRDLSNACRKAGIKFGVYLSPWDMHEETYGTDEYNKFFINQLTELLTNYGEISEVWFDGASGEGKKQDYDWHAYYELIRKLQPDAVIAIMGPDVRWVGTESGYGRKTEWSVLPGSIMDQEKIAESSQQKVLDGAFIPRDLTDEDLGSRGKILSLEAGSSLIWYPAEIDVSIRPGWFYHEDEDDFVKTPYQLVDIYYNSVGLNGVLLLNVPPDERGLIHENDIKSLQGMRYILDETFRENLVINANASASNELKGNEAKYILDDDTGTYWTTEDEITPVTIEIDLGKEHTFNRAMLQENILKGQRVEKFRLEHWTGKEWITFQKGTTIGYKRLLRFPEITAERIRIIIDECRSNPTLSSFGLYKAPPEVQFEPDPGAFADSIFVKITSDTKDAKIFYTSDGSIPDTNSGEYRGEIVLHETSTITAVAVSNCGKRSLPVSSPFIRAKYKVELKTGFDYRYSGGGKYALVDGVTGSLKFKDGRWQGYHGTDLEIIIDLGEKKEIKKISSGFLRDIGAYIFLPEYMEYYASDDKKNFTLINILKNDTPQDESKAMIKTFEYQPENISARFILVRAKNIGICPDWHIGSGDKAWLFADEINIEIKRTP